MTVTKDLRRGVGSLVLGVIIIAAAGCGPPPEEKAAKNLAQGRFFLQSYFQSLERLKAADTVDVATAELEDGWLQLAAANTACGLNKSALGAEATKVSDRMGRWVEDLQRAHLSLSQAYQQAVQVDEAIATPEYLLSSFVRGASGDPMGGARDALAAQQAAAYQWQARWSDLSATVQGGIGAMSTLDRWIQAHPEYEDIFRRVHGVD